MSRPEHRMAALTGPGNWLAVALPVTAAIISFADPAAGRQTPSLSAPSLTATPSGSTTVELWWTEAANAAHYGLRTWWDAAGA